MTKRTTNLLLMLITILAGIYFYVNYCNSCSKANNKGPMEDSVEAPETKKDAVLNTVEL